MFSIILVIFSTTETENDSFLPPKAFFTLSFISFTDTITKFPPKNAYNSPVSINTPTKGVTNHVNLSNVCWMFQSTHPRRVWLYIRFCQGRSCRFQSTHPRRVWPSHPRAASSWGLFQSTHPRRVWQNRLLLLLPLPLFQSTHPRRVWRLSEGRCAAPSEFQSTHPRRVWRSVGVDMLHLPSFNPHTHEGCDRLECYCTSPAEVSIHTPTKGVTYSFFCFSANFWVSIHTPTKGVTELFLVWQITSNVSIHTPTKGVTSLNISSAQMGAVSIHTPTKGVTAKEAQAQYDELFQSTHPRRVWLIWMVITSVL